MANTLRFKRGLAAGIPTGVAGEPLFTTDTFDLYIGNGTTNTRFQKYIASGASTQLLRGDGSLLTMPIVLTSPANGEVLKYNGTSWVNDSDAGITGSGAAGQVAYFTGATTQAGNNNLFWDATNNRLGIGINVPLYRLHNVGSSGFDNGASGDAITFLNNGFLRMGNTRFRAIASQFTFQDDLYSNKITFSMSGSACIFNTGGNYLFGGESDSGQRLQVTGDTLLKGSGNTSATTALTVQNSSSQNAIRLRNDASILFGNNASPIYAYTYSSVYDTIDINGTNFSIYPLSGSISLGGATITPTSGAANNIITKGRFQPSSGTATFTEIRSESLINQTGGANGITRGLYVNPTLTAAADWRSIEWSNNSGWGLYGAGTANNYLNGSLSVGNTTVSTFGNGGITLGSTTNGKSLVITSSVAGNNGLIQFIDASGSDAFQIAASTTNISLYGYGARPMILWTNGSERARIFSATGNFGINTGATDSGEKLQVNGTAKITGNLAVDTNVLFVDTTNDRVGIGTASPTYKLDVQGTSNTVGIRTLSNTAGDILYYATGTVTGSLNAFTTSINATGSVAASLQNNNTATGSSFLDINVPSASTGDPYLSFTTSGATNWSIGIDNSDSDKLKFGNVSNPSNGATTLVLHTTGNTSLGSAADSGEKLQVNGTAKITGATNFGTTVTFSGSTIYNGGAVIRSDNGTAAAPSISFESDLNTGIYRISNDILGIATGGAEQFRITGTGANFTSSVTAASFVNTSQNAFLLNNSGVNNDFRLGSATSVFRIVNFANTVGLLSITDTGEATFTGNLTVDSNTFFVDAIANEVGIGTNAPNSVLQVVGSVSKSISDVKTANYTATASDHTILCSAASGAVTITLPAASGITGRIYVIKKTNASSGVNSVTVDGNGSETIDGSASINLACKSSVTLQCDGSNWHILSLYSDTSCL
jgi:hypothetical protein